MTIVNPVNPDHYNIPMTGNPDLHRNLQWYATADDKVLGVVVLDLIDKDYSWVMLTEDAEQGPGFSACDMKHSLPSEEAATIELHATMKRHTP